MKDLLFIYAILMRNVKRFTESEPPSWARMTDEGRQIKFPKQRRFISRNFDVEHWSLGSGLASASVPGEAGRSVLVEAQKFCSSKSSGWLSAGSHSFL